MRRLLGIVGMAAGGWIGWKLGALASIFVGFLVSVTGAGVGLYLVYRFVDEYRP